MHEFFPTKHFFRNEDADCAESYLDSLAARILTGLVEMETYVDKKHMRPEAPAETSASYLTWFYGRNLLSAPKFGPGSVHVAQYRPESAISVHPICTVAPTPERTEVGTKDLTLQGKHFSLGDLNQTNPDIVSPKQSKNSKKKKKKASDADKSKAQGIPGGGRRVRKELEITNAITNFDLSMVPPPYCSCTGVARACHKWGGGSWQSSCCTNSISQYPLPPRPSRPGSRISGRKMTHGAYTKVLLKLAAEGYDLTHAVDLKDRWSRIGTNQFITIK